MDKQQQALQHNLEAAVQRADAEGIEFWFARDLQESLGYARWENFQTAIQRATESCEASGHAVSDHFRDITKMGVCGERWASDRFATRRVANPIVAAREATAGKSPVARTRWRTLP
jgi:DNA-damage-inducible protein D